jgi:hypothetical protein
MWNRARRGIIAAAAVSAVLAITALPAAAQTAPDGDRPSPGDFEQRRAAVLERIDDRAGSLAERRALLESTASRLDGFAAEVAAATTPEDLQAAVEAARADLGDLRDQARQLAYARLVAHVGDDVEKFTARADRLAVAIEAAVERGVDATAAAAELDAAYADIGAAADLLAGLPPQAGDDVAALMPLARDAHGTVHDGQAHLRDAFSLLREAVGGIRPAAGEARAF